MANLGKGIIAGLIATVALSVLMVAKGTLGLLPEMNVIQMLSGMSHKAIGTPATPIVGWLLHFVIGAVLWGALFVGLTPDLPGRTFAVQGMAFSVVAWLLMMVLLLPVAGAGLFGYQIGAMVPLITLVLHLIYGAVLGAAYSALGGRSWERGGAHSHSHG